MQHVFEGIAGFTDPRPLPATDRKLDPKNRTEDGIGAAQLLAARRTGTPCRNQLVAHADEPANDLPKAFVGPGRIVPAELFKQRQYRPAALLNE
jgi:hypothetical protein